MAFKRSTVYKKLAIIIPLVIVILAAVYLWHKMQSPVTGTLGRSVITEPIAASKTAGIKTLDTKLVHLDYNGLYAVQPVYKADVTSLEQHRLWTDQPYSKNLTVVVEKLPAGGLIEHSGYKLRTTKPDQYTEQVFSATTRVMTTKTGNERLAFITKGPNLAMIGLTTSGPPTELEAELKQILSTFSWK